MEKFIERQNITRFTTLLMTETDTAKRELLQKLLTDEMVRQASHGDAKLQRRTRLYLLLGALEASRHTGVSLEPRSLDPKIAELAARVFDLP